MDIFQMYEEERKKKLAPSTAPKKPKAVINIFEEFEKSKGFAPTPIRLGEQKVDATVKNRAPMPVETLEKGKEYSFKELYTNPQLFQVIEDYQAVTGGELYDPKQSKEDYVKDFMSKRRYAEWNTVFGLVPELAKMKNADAETAQKMALGQRLFEQTASMFSKEGQSGVRPYWDILKSLAKDPVSYMGMGVGKIASGITTKQLAKAGTQQALEQAAKQAVKKGTAVGAVTEGGIAAVSDITSQRLEQETARQLGEEPEELSLLRTGISTILGAGGGAVSARAVVKGKIKPASDAIAEQINKRGGISAATPDDIPDILVDPINQNMDNVVSDYMKTEGRRILDEIDPAGVITDSKVKTSMSAAAVKVALKVTQLDPTFRIGPTQKVSDVINNVFANLDQVDDVALERAIREVGLTPEQFAATNKITVTEAARVMQQYSTAAKMMKRLTAIDPDFEKKMTELYGDGATAEANGWFKAAVDGIKRVERESKAIVTSGIDTTVRNLIGTNIGLTVKSAVNLMEGLVFASGVALKSVATGKGFTPAKKAAADAFKDSLDTFFYLRNNDLAGEVMNTLLADTPSLRSQMTHALQETDRRDISKLAQWASTLNSGVDSFYRRAIFTASVEQQLRRVGIDLYTDVLGKNKQVPNVILQRGIDDALKTTFSYMPKPARGAKGMEKVVEGGANLLVKTIESVPFGSLAIPFPRFMANAMAFQYRYSPLGVAGAVSDFTKGLSAAKAGNAEKATMLYRAGMEKTVQGAVGTAALAAAYQYRVNNPDSNWYDVKQSDGNTIDIRAIFPLAPYFAVADVLARNKQGIPAKTSEAIQAVVGMKLPAGTQNVMLDQMIASLDSERDADKFAVNAGKIVGDFFGRFAQPFVVKNIYDVVDLFREDGTIARDPNVLEEETFTEAATARIKGKIPVLKEELAPAAVRLQDKDYISREGEFFNRLIGFRETPEKSDAEKEIIKLAINPYSLYGSSSGDREYDNAVIRQANALVLPTIERVISDKRYQSMSPAEQRLAMMTVLKPVVSQAREIVTAQMTIEDRNRVNKMRFNKLGEDQRRVINNWYKTKNGVTLEEANAYNELDLYEAMLATLTF